MSQRFSLIFCALCNTGTLIRRQFHIFLLVSICRSCAANMSSEPKPVLSEILPTKGLVFSERPGLSEVLCKPKILPIKSLALEKLERLEAAATQAATVDDAAER
eukprot:19145-Heterococcus_DN1.PRE.1